MRKLTLLGLLFACGKCMAIDAHDIYLLINARLGYMEDVAYYKYVNNVCIENREREKAVLSNAQTFAEDNGLDEVTTVDFFKTQIEIAKVIQYRARAHFYTSPPTKEPMDLANVLRPEISNIGKQLNEKLSKFLNDGKTFDPHMHMDFYQQIRSPYLTTLDKHKLFDSLLEVQLKPSED